MNHEQTRPPITAKAVAIIAIHALVLWILCGAIMMIGRELWSIEAALIVHAVGAPILAMGVSLVYFTYFNYTTPLQTATIFTLTPIILDALIVASLIEKSFDMFRSPIGTWIPFGLIFIATYLTGSLIERRKARQLAI